VLSEEPAELSLADAEALREVADAAPVDGAVGDEREATGDGVRRAAPDRELRGGLRPAAKACSKPGLLRRRGARIEDDVLEPRRPRGTDRAAVDSGRLDGDEDAAVEAAIPARGR
jgi:hypothetical protein